MKQATHAQLERLTMTDGSVGYQIVIRDADEKDSEMRIDFATEMSARVVLEILRDDMLVVVADEISEVSH